MWTLLWSNKKWISKINRWVRRKSTSSSTECESTHSQVFFRDFLLWYARTDWPIEKRLVSPWTCYIAFRWKLAKLYTWKEANKAFQRDHVSVTLLLKCIECLNKWPQDGEREQIIQLNFISTVLKMECFTISLYPLWISLFLFYVSFVYSGFASYIHSERWFLV